MTWVAALAAVIGWVALKGGPFGVGPFFRTEIAPGIFGTVLEPPSGTPPREGVVVLPSTEGWDKTQAEAASALAQGGAIVVVVDYYRGGRDSYHGSPHESSQELWDHWLANLEQGLTWVSEHRRGLSWRVLAPTGRPTELLAAAKAPFLQALP